MPKRTVTQAYERTVREEEQAEVTLCCSCAEECSDDYATLSNVSKEGLRRVSSLDELETLRENMEVFYLCPDCQRGLKESHETIAPALYDSEAAETAKRVEKKRRRQRWIQRIKTAIAAWFTLGAIFWVAYALVDPVAMTIGTAAMSVALAVGAAAWAGHLDLF